MELWNDGYESIKCVATTGYYEFFKVAPGGYAPVFNSGAGSVLSALTNFYAALASINVSYGAAVNSAVSQASRARASGRFEKYREYVMVRKLNRITYVEDEPDIREVAQIALETLGGFTLDICACGAEAVEKAPLFEPDLILLDVMMPGMDGIETFHKLRSNPKLSNTPIVFMTAKAQPSEVERYKALGCAGIVAKPFDPVALPGEIRAIWNHRKLEMQT